MSKKREAVQQVLGAAAMSAHALHARKATDPAHVAGAARARPQGDGCEWGRGIRIGYEHPDSLLTYPEAHNLSRSAQPIQTIIARSCSCSDETPVTQVPMAASETRLSGRYDTSFTHTPEGERVAGSQMEPRARLEARHADRL